MLKDCSVPKFCKKFYKLGTRRIASNFLSMSRTSMSYNCWPDFGVSCFRRITRREILPSE